MEQEEVLRVLKKTKKIKTIIILATKAYHLFGDASRKNPSLCFAYGEAEGFFVGCWCFNSFLFDVVFLKETTRRIESVDDIEKYLNPYHVDTRDLGYL